MAKKTKQPVVSKLGGSVQSATRSVRSMAGPMTQRKGPLHGIWALIMWLVAILVSLAVGFGMVDETLNIPFLPGVLTMAAGWIVIILAILGVLFKIVDKLSAG